MTYHLGGMEPVQTRFTLGLQGVSGHAEFDLDSLAIGAWEGRFRRVNGDWRTSYGDYRQQRREDR